ncbi:hypothetical protein Dimus_039526 [Dionaea muscipula]
MVRPTNTRAARRATGLVRVNFLLPHTSNNLGMKGHGRRKDIERFGLVFGGVRARRGRIGRHFWNQQRKIHKVAELACLRFQAGGPGRWSWSVVLAGDPGRESRER